MDKFISMSVIPTREDSRGMRLAFCEPATQAKPPAHVEEIECHDCGLSDEEDISIEDLFARPSAEAPVRPLPAPVPKKPSDREAHRRILEQCYRSAHRIAAAEAAVPISQGRWCIAGLLVVAALRLAAWCEGIFPGRVLFGIHWLTSTSDMACLLCALPFYLQGTKGQCVQFGCIGPMVTLVFSMCLADIGALLAYLAIARPAPLSAEEKSLADVLEACIGVWEFLLFASVAMQMALCLCSWRVYRELRMTGLYPPGGRPLGVGNIVEVSCLELVCEADDASRISSQCAQYEYPDPCATLLPKAAQGTIHDDKDERLRCSRAFEAIDRRL
mmetsp:Transcript_27514/g.69083  ORF Transcript_27514/g.69083 Transcript_27514/m.69083 type:complete len:330 (+) Transcript_27514:136-1125(+)